MHGSISLLVAVEVKLVTDWLPCSHSHNQLVGCTTAWSLWLLHAKHATQYNKFSGVSTNHRHHFIGIEHFSDIFFVYLRFLSHVLELGQQSSDLSLVIPAVLELYPSSNPTPWSQFFSFLNYGWKLKETMVPGFSFWRTSSGAQELLDASKLASCYIPALD